MTVMILDSPRGSVCEEVRLRQRWSNQLVATVHAGIEDADHGSIGCGRLQTSLQIGHPLRLLDRTQFQELARGLLCSTKFRKRVEQGRLRGQLLSRRVHENDAPLRETDGGFRDPDLGRGGGSAKSCEMLFLGRSKPHFPPSSFA